MADNGGRGGACSGFIGLIVILAILNLRSYLFNWPIWFW
jgi:hypothetical protein